MRGEAGAMTNIYKNIYLRKEEEVLYNIRKNVDETVETPTISKIIDYVLADPYEHIIYMDVKLKMVTSYDATNVFVDTGYKNMSREPLFLSLVLKDDVFTGKYVGTIDQLGNAILTIVKMRVNEQEIYDNMEFLKNNYGNYKQFVDDWDLKAGEREKDNNLGDMSILFEGIDISEFPETAEEIPSSEDTTAASESDFYEEDMDAKSENGQELLLEEIKNDKMYVYDYIPDKLYLVECHTMLGTINFSLVNNYMDVFGDKIPLYSLFIVQYNQGTSLGQLLQDVDLRQYNLQIPDKIIDEISDAVNYIRGYMGRE